MVRINTAPNMAVSSSLTEFFERVRKLESSLNFDTLSLSLIDLEKGAVESCHFGQASSLTVYDLASVTKAMTFGLLGLSHPELFSEELTMLSEHRAGLPSWGLLPHEGWEKILLDFKIQPSPTLYSDYSALRLMLELEDKLGREKLFLMFKQNWSKGMKFWTELETNLFCPVTGSRNGIAVQGQVHDPNAWVLGRPVVHAGLFATIDSLAETVLLNYQKHKFSLMRKWLMEKPKDQRFCHGWDTPQAPNSLAGEGWSSMTFGHLGFTGCSVWIDLDRKIAGLILSNATQRFWYAKDQLNLIRREFYSLLWHSFKTLA
jgi:CubicO group peptidase (beta-lactamase class C family)